MKILVTAGASWIKVDAIRILTNRFTGKTGLELALALKKMGHKVTLLVNPHCLGQIKGIRVLNYWYFDQFVKAITKELSCNDYDAIIHNAALSDYKVVNPANGKISSGKAKIDLKLIPVPKVIKKIRKLAPTAALVQFKLEAWPVGLEQKALTSLIKNKSDYVVANCASNVGKGYKGFILDKQGNKTLVLSRQDLAKKLNKILLSRLAV